MERYGPTRLALVVMIILALGMVACGGDDDDDGGDGNVPVVSGADRLDEGELNDEDLADIGFSASEGSATVYTSDASFDEINDFYENLEGDWEVVTSFPGETPVYVLNSGQTIAFVTATTGEEAKADQEFMDDETLDIDEDDIEDDDSVIVVVEATCAEENIEDCLAGFVP